MFAEINKKALKALPFATATIGESKPQSKIVRPRGLEAHQIIWVTDGSAIFTFGSEKYSAKKGDGFFMRAGIPHEYEGNFSTMWMTFTMSEDALDYLGAGDYFQFVAPSYLYDEMSRLSEFAGGNSNPVTRSCAGYTLVTELFSRVLSDSLSHSARVREILECRFSEPLSLYDIADEVGLDRYSLCRIYKKERGITVMEELFKIRISKAKSYLKLSNDSVASIALMCGFENSCYFIKRFREAVGCTPIQYRKRNQNSNPIFPI